MAYFDIKVSVWQRVQIPDEVDLQKVIKFFEEYDGTSNIGDIGIDVSGYETLHDSEHDLRPEENGGESTVEIYNSHANLVWNNKPQ